MKPGDIITIGSSHYSTRGEWPLMTSEFNGHDTRKDTQWIPQDSMLLVISSILINKGFGPIKRLFVVVLLNGIPTSGWIHHKAIDTCNVL